MGKNQPKSLKTEAEVMKLIETECHKYGYRLFKNNSGAHSERGLGNRSKKFDSYMKSCDLIGFKMVEESGHEGLKRAEVRMVSYKNSERND